MMVYYVAFSLCLLIASCYAIDGPTVRIPQGLVQGTYKKSYRNRTFSAFEGIPYAKPPIGELRFQEPLPASGWDDTLVADTHYECKHFLPFPVLHGLRGHEDCLYVYVYVPRIQINPNELLDVVVHIHGGGFMMGAPKYMAGPEFLMDRDVVVVSLNYRLGLLGFMSTEDDVVSGNNGLKDQSLALQWIKDNIKYFGGNPASITLTGLSAGASSVHLHYFSPLSKGLFHRGFSQSGTALQCWSLAENSLEKARTVARNVSCPTTSNKEMVECMRKVDVDTLINGILPLFVYMEAVPFVPFGPVVEKGASETAFITEHPYKTLQARKNVYDVPWITSNTKDEALLIVGLIALGNKFEEIEQKWYDIMQYALELHYTVQASNHRNVLKQIKDYYFKGQAFSSTTTQPFIDLINDRMFFVDAEKALRLQSQATKSSVYYYKFSYTLSMPNFLRSAHKGVSHGDDGRLLFKMFMTPSSLSNSDDRMVDYFVDFLTLFAKSGMPSMKSGVDWPPVKPGGAYIDFLDIIGPENIYADKLQRLSPSVDFWEELPINEGEDAAASSFSSPAATQQSVVALTILVLLSVLF